jgi:hypothetical protein
MLFTRAASKTGPDLGKFLIATHRYRGRKIPDVGQLAYF